MPAWPVARFTSNTLNTLGGEAAKAKPENWTITVRATEKSNFIGDVLECFRGGNSQRQTSLHLFIGSTGVANDAKTDRPVGNALPCIASVGCRNRLFTE